MEANQWGAELRAARVAEGHSQAVAAARLRISRSHLGNLETGKKDPSLQVARRALAVYHVSLRFLAEVA